MKDLSNLISELHTLAASANEAAEALERLQLVQNTEVRWTMTVEEVANALDICSDTIYEQVRQKQFPARKMGKRIVIPRLAVLKWMEGAAI